MLKVRVASKAEQSLLLLKTLVSKRRQMEVTVTEVVKLNQSEGVIVAPDLEGNDLELIKEECEEICDITRMTKFVVERNRREYTHTYKVLFPSRKVPETLTIGYRRFKVRCFLPAPRSCFACLSYNHILKDCPVKDKVTLCRHCGLNAGSTVQDGKRVLNSHTCQRQPKCPNCRPPDNEHSPMSTLCPARTVEKEVVKVKVENDVSYREARSRVEAGSYVSHDKSFAETLKTPKAPKFMGKDQNAALEALEKRIKELEDRNCYLEELIAKVTAPLMNPEKSCGCSKVSESSQDEVKEVEKTRKKKRRKKKRTEKQEVEEIEKAASEVTFAPGDEPERAQDVESQIEPVAEISLDEPENPKIISGIVRIPDADMLSVASETSPESENSFEWFAVAEKPRVEDDPSFTIVKKKERKPRNPKKTKIELTPTEKRNAKIEALIGNGCYKYPKFFDQRVPKYWKEIYLLDDDQLARTVEKLSWDDKSAFKSVMENSPSVTGWYITKNALYPRVDPSRTEGPMS